MEQASGSVSDLPDFTGKVLNLNLADDEADRDLVSPTFEMQGGRLFLVGEVPAGATTSEWSTGARGAVSWESVTSYLVFDSIAHYATAVERSREKATDDKEPT